MKEQYFPDIFYTNKENNFPPELQEKIIRDAKEKSFKWWVDHLPSFQRQRIDMPFDEVIKYLYVEKPVHFTIIYRRGWEENKLKDSNEWFLEIGFCTLGRKNKLETTKIDIKGDLYLWVLVEKKYLDYFIQTYNLIIKKIEDRMV